MNWRFGTTSADLKRVAEEPLDCSRRAELPEHRGGIRSSQADKPNVNLAERPDPPN